MKLIGMAAAIALVAAPASQAAGATSGYHARPRKLSSMLLSLDQMPVGWIVQSRRVDCQNVPCALNDLKTRAQAQIAFVPHEGAKDVLTERLAIYAKPAQAFAKLVSKIGGGGNDSMSFPKVGDESVAYRSELFPPSPPLGEGIVIFRQGAVVGAVVETLQTPNARLSHFSWLVRDVPRALKDVR